MAIKFRQQGHSVENGIQNESIFKNIFLANLVIYFQFLIIEMGNYLSIILSRLPSFSPH